LNICTAQALNALAGVIYLSWLGRRGIVELAELMLQRTAYARERLTAIDGIELPPRAAGCSRVRAEGARTGAAHHRRCREQGINPGYPLSREYPEFGDGLLVAITERRTRAEIDRFCEVLAQRSPPSEPRARCERELRRRRPAHHLRTLAAGPSRVRTAEAGCAGTTLDELLAPELRREEAPRLPESQNPKSSATSTGSRSGTSTSTPASIRSLVHDEAQSKAPRAHRSAARPREASSAPRPTAGAGCARADVAPAGGAREIAGLPHVSLQPSAGSHGELAGVLLTRAYHEDRGDHRSKVLTPDTAHGTNPAT